MADSAEMTVTLTEQAAAKAVDLAAKENIAPVLLRFAVEGGGCGGLQYGLGFLDADQVEDEDFRFSFGEVTVIVDRFSMPYLKGATIDFVDGLAESGFQIDNPNAVSSCGCGHSFTADDVDGTETNDGACGSSGCGC